MNNTSTEFAPGAQRRKPWRAAAACMAALAFVGLNASAGIITGAATRATLGGNDMVDWGTLADDGTAVGTSYARTSADGVVATASLATDMYVLANNGNILGTNFADGDIALSTFIDNGPISILFGSAVRGVGFNIAHLEIGDFIATLSFFGAGNTLFDTITVNGTNTFDRDGLAVFLGGTSSLRDILRVDVAVDLRGGNTAFSINQMSLLTTAPPGGGGGQLPEPTSLALVSLALAGTLLSRQGRRGAAITTT